MPELPEVETTRQGIRPHIENQKVKLLKIHNPNLRWPVPLNLPSKIKNKEILAINRRGKYLLLEFQNGTMLWHLGMSGSMRIIEDKQTLQKHDHIELTTQDGTTLRYNDPRRFGTLQWTEAPVEEHPLIAHLGPEPLSQDFHWEYLYAQSRKKTQAVKTWIMDSKVVVGVGNIYANESLFLAGIHPLKPVGKLTKNQTQLFVDIIKQVLAKAIKQGGTTLKDFTGADGKPGYFKQQLNVYGRGGKPCVTCSKPLTEKMIGQRATVYCTRCQKR